MEVTVENRDPFFLNDHLKATFEDVFGEPDSYQSADCVWRNSILCFNCAKSCCYNVMAALCALPLSFIWGCEFAYITFTHVWYVTPCLRVFVINCGSAQKFFGTCLQCCLGPVCETMGLLFSNIVYKQDIPAQSNRG